jgi:GTP cyclohydrolase I
MADWGKMGDIIIPMLQPPEKSAEQILTTFAGLNNDEHGSETPRRFLNMLDELTACKDHEASDCTKWKDFPSDGYDEMIVIEKIPFVSVCNHHVIPFMGYAHVGYVPGDTMAGLSKFARTVQHFARQLQVQERLTKQVADCLEGKLSPRGVVVVLKAEHLCMTIRGVQAPGAITTTSAVRGVFADHDRTAKAEFMSFINGGK